ncbi:short chain dehydrogenase [Aliifodinibius salipaludis]|uniref:Short chain dehydrogenase n=1 Tax=Fodinibius salipaludis TaxID=2032627 RepID=A0A2A2GC25_9BACT|nr:SDR family oxidoreductase [Aliifodinibius salipaludis]PAU94534.1 short chain dehydrogenase [Aliifodinibius salipaludis]
MSFQDKIVWITGASSGIGEALAYELSNRGAKLILSSRRKEALTKVKENCQNPSDVHIITLDLSKTDQLPVKAKEALDIFGHIDYLFNNGGISQRSEAINTKLEVIRRVMEINFFGSVALTKAVLPSMTEHQSGHIVITSSVMGKFGTRLRSSYAASKHALHGYFDSLRQEVYDDDIKISIVCPGFIKTNVTKNALEADGSKHNKMGKGQKNGMPADEFADKLIPKILKEKEEIYIGGKEIWGVYLKRFFPRLFNKMLRNTDVT